MSKFNSQRLLELGRLITSNEPGETVDPDEIAEALEYLAMLDPEASGKEMRCTTSAEDPRTVGRDV